MIIEKNVNKLYEKKVFSIFPFQPKPPDFKPYFGSGDVWFGSRRATTQVLGKVFVPKRQYCGEDQCIFWSLPKELVISCFDQLAVICGGHGRGGARYLVFERDRVIRVQT